MNRWTVVMALCWLSVVVMAEWTDSSWTDSEYGGTMYICFEDDDMTGSYSEYGVVLGQRDGNRIRGVWYEAGDGDCNHGDFDWNLLDNERGFTGFWTCGNGARSGIWSETRVGGASTTDEVLCAKIMQSPIIGEFTADQFTGNFCFKDDDDYTVSYSDSVIEGFQTGPQYEDARVSPGVFYESGAGSSPTGRSLFFHMASGQVGQFYWRFDDADEIDTRADISNPNLHGFRILNRQGETSNEECNANDYLLPENPQEPGPGRMQAPITASDTSVSQSFPSTASPRSTSGSSMLMASFALLLLAVTL